MFHKLSKSSIFFHKRDHFTSTKWCSYSPFSLFCKQFYGFSLPYYNQHQYTNTYGKFKHQYLYKNPLFQNEINLYRIVHFISILFLFYFFAQVRSGFFTSTYPVLFPTSVVVVFSFPIRSLFIHWFIPHLRRFNKVGEWASLYNFVMSKTSF